MGCRLYFPMSADPLGGANGSYRLVRHVESGLGGAAQQPIPGVAGVDNTLDTDDGPGVDLPVPVVEFVSGIENADGAPFVAVATLVMAVVRAERRRGGSKFRDILMQGRLVALDLDD